MGPTTTVHDLEPRVVLYFWVYMEPRPRIGEAFQSRLLENDSSSYSVF
jgi:hypothetical protein